jgi:hypothetical protein
MDGGEWTGELLLLTLMDCCHLSGDTRTSLMVGLTFEMGRRARALHTDRDEAEEKRHKK